MSTAETVGSFAEFQAANPNATTRDYSLALAEQQRARANALGMSVEELHTLGSRAIQLMVEDKETTQTA